MSDLNDLRSFVGRGVSAQKAVDDLIDNSKPVRGIVAAQEALRTAPAGCFCRLCDEAKAALAKAAR